jgi:hypothetical protein
MSEDDIKEFCEENNIKFISSEIVNKFRKITFIATECSHQKTAFWTNVKKLSGVKTCNLSKTFQEYMKIVIKINTEIGYTCIPLDHIKYLKIYAIPQFTLLNDLCKT